jgi:hypothetical protein
MPLFRAARHQVVATGAYFLVFAFAYVRIATLSNVGHPRARGEHVETLAGSVGHASFIRLAPFGFAGGPPVNRSQLDASVAVTLGGVTPALARKANFTDLPNRTVFYLMLCDEHEWQQIVDARPSYCNTASYQDEALCMNIPLAPLVRADQTTTYTSTTEVHRVVHEASFARLVFTSCELNGPTLAQQRHTPASGALDKDAIADGTVVRRRVSARVSVGFFVFLPAVFFFSLPRLWFCVSYTCRMCVCAYSFLF